ncbi:MAG: hypothetical protein FOGNACKC_01114 [Anaerolineae bacterium]|nr:hypothetical protein [Anaerolineae bacterium]
MKRATVWQSTLKFLASPTFHLGLSLLVLLVLAACATSATATNSAAQPSTPTPTPTNPPPPPVVKFTPVPEDTVSPIIVQRFPRRGEELPVDGVVELSFDRAMNQSATAAAFTLQTAADQPQPVTGDISWADGGRTLRFKPAQPLERAATYDALLTQQAVAADGAPLAEPFTFRFGTPGDLEVAQVIPADGTADVETASTITVMFNRPVVPLTSLAEAENFPQPLTFDPPIKGAGEWLNTSIYVFTPAGDIPGGTTFKATVKAGLKDVANKTDLPADFSWSFTTQPPEVVFTTPNDGQTLVPIEDAISVQFSQSIDAQSAQSRFSLSTGGLFGGSVSGQFEVVGNTLTFTPTQRLDFDQTYQVKIDAGVTNVAGGNGMVSPYSFRFTTVPLPRIVETVPANGAQDASPYTDFTIVFNTAIKPATVMEHIEMDPPLPITPTLVYTSYSPWNNGFSISFGAKPATDYRVRIRPGIEDPYGNKTTDDLTVRFRTLPLPPRFDLRTPDFIATYDSALPAKVVVGVVNLTTLDFKLYRLDPQQIIRPQWEWYDFTPDQANLIRQWREQLTTPDNELKFQPIDLVEGGGSLEPGLYLLDTDSPQLPQQDRYGRRHLLVVSDLNLTLKAGQKDALAWATELASGQPIAGLEVVFYDENDRRELGRATTNASGVAQLDLSSRTNRASVLAAVLPAGQQTRFSAVSENWARGVSPYDFGVDPVYQLPPFTTHIYTDRPIYRPGQTVYFKGIIRAEDDVKFSLPDIGRVQVTVRDANYQTILDKQLALSPNATFADEIKLEAGAALGSYVIGLQFNDQYFEQYFQVAAYRPPEFEVTVEPEKTELLRGSDLNAVINTRYFFGGPLAGADIQWNVLAENYYFKPAQLGNYSFNDADDPYTCFDCWWWRQPSAPTPVQSGSGASSATGELAVQIDGQTLSEALQKGSYKLTIEATATGPDNQVISGRSEVILHKGDYYLGLSPTENVADAGQETAVDLVAVDWAGQRLPNKTLDVRVIRHEWVNTFVPTEFGGTWQSEEKKEEVDKLTVTTDARGEAVARFTPPQGGSYQIVAQDAATVKDDVSPIRSSVFIWVAGKNDVSWRRENNDRLTLISDKATYAPGETAEILIPSPFSGPQTALVTVERGRIIQQEVIKFEGSSQVYRLPLTENYAPNIYVSVVLVQGRDGPKQGDAPRLAAYKVGLLPIDVTPSAQKLNVTLAPSPEQGQPGQPVTFDVLATDANNQPVAAEFSLDMVDKAVLTLQPRQPEAIVQAFYGRRGLGINTAAGLAVSANQFLLELAQDLGLEQDALVAQTQSMRQEVVAESEAMPTGSPPMPLAAAPMEEAKMAADSAAGAVAPNQAQIPAGIDVREEFADTAYWNPTVVTDQSGRAQVSLKLPDNLTTWVTRGVGITRDTRVGEATVELVSTLPLLIRPVAPRFFVVDDKAQLAANVSNNTDEPLQAEVTLATDAGVVIDTTTAAVQTVEIPARGETKVTWDVAVTDVASTTLTFAAVSTDGRYQDASKPRLTTGPDGSLLVFRYTAPDTVGTAGQLVGGGDRTEIIALPPNFDERRGDLTVQLDPSLAAGMVDGLKYLEHYQYECTEQTVSRFLPNVLTFDALQKLGIENKELAARLPGLVDEGLNKLYAQQKPDGGWGWWASSESNVHITAYVVFALTRAQQAGVNVSATVLANGQNFLLSHLQSTRQLTTTYDANRHAWVLYVLAEGGAAPRDSLAALFDAREKLSHYGRAYLALALSLTDKTAYSGNIQTLLSDLNNAAILSATGAHWEEHLHDWWAMNTDTRSTAVILDALARLDPNNALIPNVVRWLMVARKDGIWETTQETAWALISLTDWMVVTGELDAAYDFSALLNDDEIISGSASKATVNTSSRQVIPLADLLVDTGNRLTIARTDGNGRLYYTAHLKVYLPVEQLQPADRGVMVSRRYTLQSCLERQLKDKTVVCNEVREAKLGDVIRVDLTIIAPNDLYYVVLEDPLPAGAEAIDTGLATTSLLAMDPTLAPVSRADGSEPYRPYYWWWRWYSRSELRDEKVVLFADRLPKGTYEYSYTMRATLPGDYHVMPAAANEFYFPEVFGRSDGRLLSIGQ